MKYLTGLFVSVAALNTALTVRAQEPGKEDVVRAIQSLVGKDVCLSGAIDQEEPEPSDAPGIPGAVVQKIVVGGDAAGAQFSGDLDVAVMSNGTMVLASKGSLPAIKIYRSGETVLCNQTHTDQPISPKRLLETLGKVSNWKGLANVVAESGKIRVDKKEASTDVRVVMDASFLREEPQQPQAVGGGAFGGGAGAIRVQVGGSPMQSNVVDLIATFTLTPSKELSGITFEIQYDDPMKAMMSKALRVGGGGVFRVQGNGGKNDKDEEVTLGSLVRLDFDLKQQIPANLVAFSKEAQELLSKK